MTATDPDAFATGMTSQALRLRRRLLVPSPPRPGGRCRPGPVSPSPQAHVYVGHEKVRRSTKRGWRQCRRRATLPPLWSPEGRRSAAGPIVTDRSGHFQGRGWMTDRWRSFHRLDRSLGRALYRAAESAARRRSESVSTGPPSGSAQCAAALGAHQLKSADGDSRLWSRRGPRATIRPAQRAGSWRAYVTVECSGLRKLAQLEAGRIWSSPGQRARVSVHSRRPGIRRGAAGGGTDSAPRRSGQWPPRFFSQ